MNDEGRESFYFFNRQKLIELYGLGLGCLIRSQWAFQSCALPSMSNYCPISFFNRSITSGGCDITSLANASTSSPLLGSISSFLFLASAKNAGSFTVFVKASRKTLTCSGRILGGPR